MRYTCFVSPKVVAAYVTKGQPNARMHRVVVHCILAFARWMVASHLLSIARFQIGEIGSKYLRILKNEIGDRLFPE